MCQSKWLLNSRLRSIIVLKSEVCVEVKLLTHMHIRTFFMTQILLLSGLETKFGLESGKRFCPPYFTGQPGSLTLWVCVFCEVLTRPCMANKLFRIKA